ncbi:MAG: ABC transporter ATP-binding protein [Rhizobiales bacterium]|jgi:putative spermidine/putrescine transport system ATP-binding protein|nr:ABC transporter ATP-binding protein [Hyphomicrobiales bacterium]
MPDSPFLDVRQATKSFGATRVLDGVDLAVKRGEFVSLLGPSGCGKTTLLRLIAGLASADSGNFELDGQEIARLPPHRRDVGVVFQSYALFPHLTVSENIAFGLKAKGAPPGEITATVRQFLGLVHMESMADRSVRALSGGQQQRVAVARALAVKPKLLLLDEPFSALDRKLRETMQIELRRLLRELAITAIFVTHDQDEALIMSDRIAVMNRGRIEQFATPEAIYARPATPFALEFVGLSTRIAGTVTTYDDAGFVTVETPQGPLRAKGRFAVGSPVLLGIRPECIRFGEGGGENRIAPVLTDIVFQGARVQAHFESQSDLPILIETSTGLPSELAAGMPVPLSFAVEDTLAYPAEVAR